MTSGWAARRRSATEGVPAGGRDRACWHRTRAGTGHGWRRSTRQAAASSRLPSPVRTKTSRSCSRLRRPAQNSTSSARSGTRPRSRAPARRRAARGRGTAPPAGVLRLELAPAPPIGSTARDAHALIREAHGREAKYSLTSSARPPRPRPAEPDRAVHRRPGQRRRHRGARGRARAPWSSRGGHEPRAALVEEPHQHGAHVRGARRRRPSRPRSPAARRRRRCARHVRGVVDPARARARLVQPHRRRTCLRRAGVGAGASAAVRPSAARTSIASSMARS